MKRYSCKKLFLFIGAIIFIIICTVFSYNSYVSKTINNSTLNLLSENTSESINDLKKDIQNRIEFLRALNKFSSADEFGSKKYFSDIEFFDTSDLSNEIYYNQLIKDKIYISEPFIQNNVKKIFIAVFPVANKVAFEVYNKSFKMEFETVLYRDDFKKMSVLAGENVIMFYCNLSGDIVSPMILTPVNNDIRSYIYYWSELKR